MIQAVRVTRVYIAFEIFYRRCISFKLLVWEQIIPYYAGARAALGIPSEIGDGHAHRCNHNAQILF